MEESNSLVDGFFFKLFIRKPVRRHHIGRTLETVSKLTFLFKSSIETTADPVSTLCMEHSTLECL